MRKLWILIFFFFGFIYRLWLMKIYPTTLIFDQVQYEEYAREMLKNGLYANSFRIYGYPLFIALVYLATGIQTALSQLTWQLIQAFFDTLTALVVYITARRIFKIPDIANFSYVLYLFNPFTAGFAGVLLPEILITFLVALLFLFLSFFLKKINLFSLIVLGLLLGYIPQVRPFYLFYSIIVVSILAVFYFIKLPTLSKKLLGVVLLLVFYVLPFTYNVLGNLKYFGEFALMDVDNLFIENFYIGLFLERSPYIKFSIWDYPPEVRWTFETYSYTINPKDQVARRKRKMIFLNAAWQEFLQDPYKFLSWRIKKIWYVWEKHTVYPYVDPLKENKFMTKFIYWSNVLILISALVGIIYYGKKVVKEASVTHKLFFIFSLLLFLNSSAVGAATSAQERYSLPAYSLVMLYSATGLYCVMKTTNHA